MLQVTEVQLMAWLSAFIWPFFRIAAFVMAAPVFGANFVSPNIRIIFAFLVSLIVAPVLPTMPVIDFLSLGSWVMIVQQLLIGFALGFFLHVFFQIFILAGQIIAMNMGLGFASMMDPSSGISVAVVSQVYLISVTLLFVLTNGHLVVLDVLIASFTALPVGDTMPLSGIWHLLMSGSWMFMSALLMALPAVTALLIVNFSFGVMSRSAPQLNVFALGFPMALLLGLFVLWLSYDEFFPQYLNLSEYALEYMQRILVP